MNIYMIKYVHILILMPAFTSRGIITVFPLSSGTRQGYTLPPVPGHCTRGITMPLDTRIKLKA